MRRLAVLLCLIAVGRAIAATVAVAPPKVNVVPKGFAEMKREAAQKFIEDTVFQTLTDALTKAGQTVVDASASPEKVVTVEILKVSQRNRTNDELLAHPNAGGSETKVEVVLSVGDERSTKLIGTAPGSFFGTTNRKDMSGAPADKGRFIEVVNRQRAQAIARAVWNAVRERLTGNGQ